MYRLNRQQQVSVVHLLCEGNSIRNIERVTGVHRDTVMRLLIRVGRRCHQFLDGRLLGLRLDHLQCDEIWTFCLKKPGRLTEEEKADDTIGDQFLFVALDQETKLIPSFLVGKRNKENTEALMLDLADRILTPLPGSLGPRPQISTAGWAAFPGALNLAFADTVKFGTLVKNYGDAEQPGRYGLPELAGTTGTAYTPGLSAGTICTSHVERGNLSIRTFMKRFTRLALGFSKKLDNLTAAVALHVGHYNFCRYHSTIRSTPAMAAGVVGSVWSVEELLEEAGAIE